jgi:hypothetical protein
MILAETLASTTLKIVIGALATVLFAGLIGQFLTYRWDELKRRRESDLAAREAFYRAYSQFFTTWKLWNSHKDRDVKIEAPGDVQWLMLRQAEEAEGGFEALMVKVASEKKLNDASRQLLAGFRQGYQSLRERIHKDQPLIWWATDIHTDRQGFKEYRAFKALAEYFATVLTQDPAWLAYLFAIKRDRPNQTEAVAALIAVTQREYNWVKLAEEKLGPLALGDSAKRLEPE